MALLTANELSLDFGDLRILRNAEFAIEPGERVCLVGRNGAGKTTTIESIMGLLPVQAGRISFRGDDVTGLPAHSRAKLGMGYSPEDCGIFPELTVAENLMVSRWLSESVAGRTCAPRWRLRSSAG